MIRSVRPTSRVTAERGSWTVTVSRCSPLRVDLMTSPVGLSPMWMSGRPGISMRAYRSPVTWSLRTPALISSSPRMRLSTMLTSRTASESTRSWALLLIVRVSTMTSETPNTAITTSTTARVELMRRRRTGPSGQLIDEG